MLTTYATNALQPFLYTYTGTIIVTTVTILAIVYSMRDMIGGFVLAGIVYYLYTM